jgi:hypothetical protein
MLTRDLDPTTPVLVGVGVGVERIDEAGYEGAPPGNCTGKRGRVVPISLLGATSRWLAPSDSLLPISRHSAPPRVIGLTRHASSLVVEV